MISQSQLFAIAKQAADAAVAGGSLSESIAKLAEKADLNQLQIQRVVELTNHAVNERMRKEASDKTFSFQLASTADVLARLPHLSERPKVAAADIVGAVRGHIGRDSARTDLSKVASAASDSRRVSARQAKQDAVKIGGWMESHYRALLVKQAGLHEEIRIGLHDLADYAANHCVSGRALVDLKKFACSYDPTSGRIWDALFDVVHEKLAERGVRGRADTEPSPLAKRAPLPRSDTLEYQVINGASRLQVFLDTLKNKISKEDELAQHIRLMDTHGPAVVAGIVALNTTEDVDRYLAEGLGKHAAAAPDRDAFLRDLEKLAGIMGALGGLGAEAARVGGAVVKRTWKPAMKYGLPIAATALAANAVGRGISKNTRDYRPGAYRGVNEGGSIE